MLICSWKPDKSRETSPIPELMFRFPLLLSLRWLGQGEHAVEFLLWSHDWPICHHLLLPSAPMAAAAYASFPGLQTPEVSQRWPRPVALEGSVSKILCIPQPCRAAHAANFQPQQDPWHCAAVPYPSLCHLLWPCWVPLSSSQSSAGSAARCSPSGRGPVQYPPPFFW